MRISSFHALNPYSFYRLFWLESLGLLAPLCGSKFHLSLHWRHPCFSRFQHLTDVNIKLNNRQQSFTIQQSSEFNLLIYIFTMRWSSHILSHDWLDQWFPAMFLDPPQHCTFSISPLSETPISDLVVSTNELTSWIKCLWLGRNAVLGVLQEWSRWESLGLIIQQIGTPTSSQQRSYLATFFQCKCIWSHSV